MPQIVLALGGLATLQGVFMCFQLLATKELTARKHIILRSPIRDDERISSGSARQFLINSQEIATGVLCFAKDSLAMTTIKLLKQNYERSSLGHRLGRDQD